eukprot:18991-Heterococcus_DN1.PRE.2
MGHVCNKVSAVGSSTAKPMRHQGSSAGASDRLISRCTVVSSNENHNHMRGTSFDSACTDTCKPAIDGLCV